MQLKDVIAYDETSPSCLRWVLPQSNRVKVGSVAGSFNKATGYWQVTVLGKLTYAHRVIAKLHNLLDDESLQVDHRDRDRSNNKLVNLRVVTQADNLLNKGIMSNNTSGFTGVTWNNNKSLWVSTITVNKRRIHLGYFGDLNDAVISRRVAEEAYGYESNY